MPTRFNGLGVALGAGVVVLLLAGGAVRAQDVVRGEELAKRWCSTCHVIDAGTPRETAVDPAPPFPMIALRDPEIIKSRITGPHVQMPQFDLGRREVDDIVAYIRTLRPSR